MNQKFRMAIFASGSGSNAEEIVKYFTNHPGIKVQVIATNNPKAMVVDRAKRLGVATKIFTREEFFSNAIADWLRENHITHIVLAGFLWLIPPSILNAYPGKIINIHPALLPKFGGKGMYGMKIHELVRSLKEKETGITIHLINERYDEGPYSVSMESVKCWIQIPLSKSHTKCINWNMHGIPKLSSSGS